MQRQEIHHHTDEQVEEYVCKALTLVNELDPDKDLRAAVFSQACALFASKQIVVAQPQGQVSGVTPTMLGRLVR